MILWRGLPSKRRFHYSWRLSNLKLMTVYVCYFVIESSLWRIIYKRSSVRWTSLSCTSSNLSLSQLNVYCIMKARTPLSPKVSSREAKSTSPDSDSCSMEKLARTKQTIWKKCWPGWIRRMPISNAASPGKSPRPTTSRRFLRLIRKRWRRPTSSVSKHYNSYASLRNQSQCMPVMAAWWWVSSQMTRSLSIRKSSPSRVSCYVPK